MSARLLRTVALVLTGVVLVSGCSSGGNSIADQARAGNNKNYIAGDGSVTTIAAAQRETTLDLNGTTLEGEPWSSSEAAGDVLVINVWGSWCPPCRDEMPDLVEVHREFSEAGEPVQFMGVNDRDSVPTAQAFERAHDVVYPSLEDNGGATRADLVGLANATPSTLVVAPDGKVAARVNGPVEASTLTALIQDVLDE